MFDKPDKYLSINELVDFVILDRCHEVLTYKVVPNKEYNQEQDKAIEFCSALCAQLPVELRKLFDEYENACHQAEGVAEKICYRQGLFDGIKLLQAFGRSVKG